MPDDVKDKCESDFSTALIKLPRVCREAIEHWGLNLQVDQVIEEGAEAIQILNHELRGRTRPGEVEDELADLYIMFHQVEQMVKMEESHAPCESRFDGFIFKTINIMNSLILWKQNRVGDTHLTVNLVEARAALGLVIQEHDKRLFMERVAGKVKAIEYTIANSQRVVGKLTGDGSGGPLPVIGVDPADPSVVTMAAAITGTCIETPPSPKDTIPKEPDIIGGSPVHQWDGEHKCRGCGISREDSITQKVPGCLTPVIGKPFDAKGESQRLCEGPSPFKAFVPISPDHFTFYPDKAVMPGEAVVKCPGIAIGDGNFSGCGGGTDCPVCHGQGVIQGKYRDEQEPTLTIPRAMEIIDDPPRETTPSQRDAIIKWHHDRFLSKGSTMVAEAGTDMTDKPPPWSGDVKPGDAYDDLRDLINKEKGEHHAQDEPGQEATKESTDKEGTGQKTGEEDNGKTPTKNGGKKEEGDARGLDGEEGGNENNG